jgi:flagellar hook-basal body complex protein FliE
MPVDPAFLATGPEWQIAAPDMQVPADPAVDAAAGVSGVGGSDFGGMLGQQLQNLADLQTNAAEASASLANGTATDPSSVVMAVERAQLSMQLASQLRTKGVEALNDIFHTQV